MAESDNTTTRVLGYLGGLRVLMDAPDALVTAVRALYTELLKSEPDVSCALTLLGLQPVTEEEGERPC